MSDPHTVADHLMDRLAELGVGRMFGVPGDYSLGRRNRRHRSPGPT